MTGPYSETALAYVERGWAGVLPLPVRRKKYPPKGYTGAAGIDPSYPDVIAWTEGPEGDGNIALRMPPDVVGLDIDDYGDKPGGTTLASGERAYGELPTTWRTTSREGVSGIRFYRVPPGLAWPGGFGPGTEIVRRGHRYAVAPPSVHPETGRPYRWITPEGAESEFGPRPDDLPDLPPGWLVGLTGGEVERLTPKAELADDDVETWIDVHDHEGLCPAMTATIARTAEQITTGSAHESLARLVGVMRMGTAGHLGLRTGLDTIEAAFMTEATRPGRSGRREQREAELEWARSRAGAVAKVVGDPGEESDHDPCEPTIIRRLADQPATEDTGGLEDEPGNEPGTGWRGPAGPAPVSRLRAATDDDESSRTDRLARRGTRHEASWIADTLNSHVQELRRSRGSAALELAEAVGFLGMHAAALKLCEREVIDNAVAVALRDAQIDEDGEGGEEAVEAGRRRALAAPWRLPGPPAGASNDGTANVDSNGPDDGDAVGDGPVEVLDNPTPEQRAELRLLAEVEEQRRRRDALRRLQAEDAPALEVLDADAFLDSPEPESLVPRLFYRDSLSRIFGAPGSGKSFVGIDLALSVATGHSWGGESVETGPVFYVMAEGQRVNTQRAKAWLERHHVDRDELRGRLFTVPDAVMLTEEAAGPFVEVVRERRPVLVILDTKNAMMVGEESSATDFAVLRRVLDRIRKAADCCVVLIDHTGYEGTRARGTSAGTAAMDTEARVENDGESPAGVTVTVTRDKAAEAGATWSFFLRSAGDSAVLVDADGEGRALRQDRAAPDWKTADGVAVPTDLLHYEGAGQKVMPELARFLAHDASARHGDPEGVGVSRSEAIAAMKSEGFDTTVVRRAWSALIAGGWIDRADGVKVDTGRHVWTP